MVVGRGVVGAAVGAASFVVPLYIAEMAPAAHRGRLVTTYVLFITIGQVLAYVIGWAFAEHGADGLGWRWMVLLGGVPAAVQAFCLLFMPETPRWLVMRGRSAEAREVIQRVLGQRRGAARLADATLKSIAVEIEQDRIRLDRHHRASEQSDWFGRFGELLATRRNRRALAIACLLQGLQQLCGFVSAMARSECAALP
jgi:SP family myo-inositol transporter-like MFS transporter 13